jgi:hypothetical protein
MDDANGKSNQYVQRTVPARLVESTPMVNGLGYWALASPLILFAGWFWVDLFAYWSPIPWYLLDLLLAIPLYLLVIILPLGYGMHRLVTAFPRVFQHTGWDVEPLEPVRPAEQYSVKYIFKERHRAQTTRQRIWLRAAQGWVYLEIAAIFIGAIAMVPLFFSAREFGFGR